MTWTFGPVTRAVCATIAPLILISSATPGSTARAGDPGFDCEQAKTPVEKELCKDGGGYAWLDTTMNDLFRTIRASKTSEARRTFVESQADWLRIGNACDAAPGTIHDCLEARYHERFLVMEKGYESGRLGGPYSSRNGVMQVVVFPDGILAFEIDSTKGPPSYNSCSFSAKGAFSDGHLHYREAVDPRMNDGASTCVVDVTPGWQRSICREQGM